MIYSFTLNPSLDYIMNLDNFAVGKINRSKSEHLRVGGKGINVSMVLRELGQENLACVFVAGTVGKTIIEELDKIGIPHRFIKTLGNSRINIKLVCENETAINGSGCIATYDDVNRLCALANTNEEDIIVLSGSVCNGLDSNVYSYIMERIEGRFVVDATGELLKNALKNKPFLVKPNNVELGEIFGCKITSFEDAIKYGKELTTMGAENVIVSMGKKGAVFVNANEEYIAKGNNIQIKYTVGAGDTMLAGFLYSLSKGNDYKKSLEYAVELAENRFCN